VLPAFLASICVLLTGCYDVDRSSRFIPSPEIAESAVKAGMEAWLKNEPPGAVANTKPVVQIVDSHRNRGLTLVRYEILGEVAGNAPRCFAVKAYVKTQKDDVEKLLRLKYVVIGIDPLWVWGQYDYDMLSHWEHPMEELEQLEKLEK
jgi:hypothetical protein